MAKLFVSQRDAPLIERINKDMLDWFDPHLIVGGMNLYRQAGGVTMLAVDDDWIASAQVKDGLKSYAAFVHMSRLASSTCSCPSVDHCEHIAAVLYAVFRRFALSMSTFNAAAAVAEADRNGTSKPAKRRPPAAAPDAQRKQQTEPANAMAPAVRTAPQPKSPLQRQSDDALPSPAGTVGSWHRYFQRTTDKPLGSPKSMLSSWGTRTKAQLLDPVSKWDPITRNLYAIHAHLHLISLINEAYVRSMTRYLYESEHSTYRQLIRDLTADLLKLAFDIDRGEVYSRHAGLLRETIDYIAVHAFPQARTAIDWPHIYRMLWWNLFSVKPLLDAERHRLGNAIAKAEQHTIQREELTKALAHLDVVEDRDDQAIATLEKLTSQVEPESFFPYLRAFRASAMWPRALHWLRWLLPAMANTDREKMAYYLSMWRDVSTAVQATDEWNTVLIRLFPASQAMYTAHAMEQGRYREWVELHIAHNILPLHADAGAMRKIAADEPAALLPYYHQAIELLIEAKNRDGYQAAVHLLTRLRPLYDNLHASSRWKQYMTHLSQHYSRLRAFQEELRKGNLHA
ncbi:SWIM zinc finger family protein [Paenibacillus cymbidii]|uniref:SWIM zinc finger family protein n=1 Tax=Paenibacillus cymbidii TaxID=1639034 RepID=UPI00107FF9A7|nr:SWIM zinc finger family protein [Paenibacillus cymbidii]